MSITFNWIPPPAPGYPGYQPHPRAQPQQVYPVDRGEDRPVNDLVDRPGQTRGVYNRLPVTNIPDDGQNGQDTGQPDQSSGVYEPYIHSRNDRPFDQWGSPDFALRGAMNYPGISPGPYMPQPYELAGLLHGIVMGVGRWGSHYSGMPAIAMGTYASAYWKAYQQGMHERANTAWQQYQHSQQMFLDRQAEELRAAKDINALYKNDPEKLHQAMYQLATKYGDQTIKNAIESGNYGAVDEIWGERDKAWNDAAKIKQQQENQKLIDEERKQLMEERRLRMEEMKNKEKADEEKRKALDDARRRMLDPNASGPAGAEPGSLPPPDTGEEPGSRPPPEPDDEPGSTAPPEPTTEGAAGGAGAVARAEPPTAFTDETPDDVSQRPVMVADASGTVPIGGGRPTPAAPAPTGPEGKPEAPFLENAAKGWVFSHKLPPSLDKNKFPDLAVRAEQRGQEIENYLNKLASDPKVTAGKMKSEVARLFPGFAANLEGYVNGDQPPPGRIGSTNQQYWDLVFRLGKKIDPQFTSSTFNERYKQHLFWTQGPGGNKMTVIGTAFDHLLDLRKLALDGKKPAQLTSGISEWWATHFGQIGEIETVRNRAIHETENALAASGVSGGGSATIPALKQGMADLTFNQSDKNFLQKIDENIVLLSQRLGEMYRQFESSTGQKSDLVKERFNDYARRAAPAFRNTDPSFAAELEKAPDALDRLMNYKAGEAKSAVAPGKGGKVIDYKDYFK